MRALSLAAALAGALLLQGCATAVALGVAADTNRQRRADARVGLADSTLAPGDTLALRLTDGTRATGTVVALAGDSLMLDGPRAFALADVERAERPWARADAGKVIFFGVLADAAILWVALRDLTFSGFGDFNFDGP